MVTFRKLSMHAKLRKQACSSFSYFDLKISNNYQHMLKKRKSTLSEYNNNNFQ